MSKLYQLVSSEDLKIGDRLYTSGEYIIEDKVVNKSYNFIQFFFINGEKEIYSCGKDDFPHKIYPRQENSR